MGVQVVVYDNADFHFNAKLKDEIGTTFHIFHYPKLISN